MVTTIDECNQQLTPQQRNAFPVPIVTERGGKYFSNVCPPILKRIVGSSSELASSPTTSTSFGGGVV